MKVSVNSPEGIGLVTGTNVRKGTTTVEIDGKEHTFSSNEVADLDTVCPGD